VGDGVSIALIVAGASLLLALSIYGLLRLAGVVALPVEDENQDTRS
jgi:hypothetical protein